LGFFAGYTYFHQQLNTFGCTQTATNPFICFPGEVATSTATISDEYNWNAIRLGFNGQWRFWDGFVFDLDFAWLPHAWLNGSDTHWLRSFTAPEGGSSSFSSAQIDALLRYQFVNGFSLGLGVRYWKFDTGFAQTFNVGNSGLSQKISVHSEQRGPLFEGRYSFGELFGSGLS
jgi:hypothetical protein